MRMATMFNLFSSKHLQTQTHDWPFFSMQISLTPHVSIERSLSEWPFILQFLNKENGPICRHSRTTQSLLPIFGRGILWCTLHRIMNRGPLLLLDTDLLIYFDLSRSLIPFCISPLHPTLVSFNTNKFLPWNFKNSTTFLLYYFIPFSNQQCNDILGFKHLPFGVVFGVVKEVIGSAFLLYM